MQRFPKAAPSDVEVVARGLIELERAKGVPLRPADEWSWAEIRRTEMAERASRVVEELRRRAGADH